MNGAQGGSPFRCLAFLVILLSLSFAGTSARAVTVHVILLPGTDFSQWQSAEAPHLRQMLATGAVGLINMRTAQGPRESASADALAAALTLGAGSRAACTQSDLPFLAAATPLLNDRITAGSLYTRRMAYSAPVGALVCPQWPQLLHRNSHPGYDLRLGNMSDTLSQFGISLMPSGGSLADALTVNSAGKVLPPMHGAANRCNVTQITAPLPAADRAIGAIMAAAGQDPVIVLATNTDSADEVRGYSLCPIGVWGRGISPGLLTSSSTRRLGLVTDTDFAPSVLSLFGVSAKQMPVMPFGSAWIVHPTPDAVAVVANLQQGADLQWEGMKVLPYLALFLGAWILLLIIGSAQRRLPDWAVTLPAGLVFAALVSVTRTSFDVIAYAALVGAFFVPRTAYYALIAAVLVVDLALGDPLMHHSLLGYSVIEGARYYGMGNEAMGALVGASLLCADALRRRVKLSLQWLIWAALVVIAVILVAPERGAKAGGILVSGLAFGSYAWLRTGRRLSVKALFSGFAGAFALLVGIAFLDKTINHAHASQLGQAAQRLGSGGLGEWSQIITRKLAVEGHLLWHSAWALPVWCGMAALLFFRPLDQDDMPLYLAGWVAIVACLAVNDAGVVAAAICVTLLVTRWARQQKARHLPEEAAG